MDFDGKLIWKIDKNPLEQRYAMSVRSVSWSFRLPSLSEEEGGQHRIPKRRFFRSFFEGRSEGYIFSSWTPPRRFLDDSEAPSWGHVGVQNGHKIVLKIFQNSDVSWNRIFVDFGTFLEHSGG